ncbi:MAG: DUF86 domain-containing protein [Acetobacteraceae bacterium]|nr:DUF86 domain-containing protein [Acetobacteraceae bacterium]
MPSDRTLLALLDIRDNARLAPSFIEGMSLAQFKSDRRTVYAVSRCLEIISEAARRLSPELRERHPDQPWRAIMGLGNVFRHDYDNVAEEILWRTVHASLPSLLSAIEPEIASMTPRAGPDVPGH